MSDLKYKSVEELKQQKKYYEDKIKKLNSDVNNAKTTLEWINKYIFEKTPQELTMQQLEARLGHKVIIIFKE